MTAAHHLPTPHAVIDGPNGHGHSWITCSCGMATPKHANLKDAWAEYREHYRVEVDTTPIAPTPPRRPKNAPLQVERLFDA